MVHVKIQLIGWIYATWSRLRQWRSSHGEMLNCGLKIIGGLNEITASLSSRWEMISCSSDSLHTRQTMNRSIVLVIFFTQIVFSFAVSDNCTTFDEKPKPEYYPLRHCQRANGTIIGFRNIKSLYECMMFARERGALAFNYAPEGRVKRNRFESLNQTLNGTFMINSTKHRKQKKIHTISEEYYNCQALACPEYGNFSTMLNDTRFDYYSLYTKPPREFS